MTSSQETTGRKRLPRLGLSALTALALAVGTLGAVPHSPLVPEAFAAGGFTGGLRGPDGKGAIEKLSLIHI
mgnify:CR=1 FL=1